ncbi:MAG TPA: hypothetical protein VN366_00165, partial [Feifaniaceae bacterium]|nr:hypothetical protein [Feifaniaceae bacterium]
MWRLEEPLKSLCQIAAGCVLSVALLVSGRVLLTEEYPHVSVFTYAAEPNRYEVRNELLLQAMERFGASTPEEAADIWANGVSMRNGAAQYSVMSAALKKKYAMQLEETAPMWVTGVSSPWVSSYWTVWAQEPQEGQQMRQLMFMTETSAGPGPTYTATLTLVKFGGSWRITDVSMDEGFYAYTGFQPKQPNSDAAAIAPGI